MKMLPVPHATINGHDVHLIWTAFRSGGHQDIVYLKQKGLNPLSKTVEFEWGFGLGSEGGDSGEAIAVDATGNVYVAGYFFHTVDFNPSITVTNKTSKGGYDIFICKYSPAGNLIWAHSIGGSNHDAASYIQLDSEGNIYVTGYFNGQVDVRSGSGRFSFTGCRTERCFCIKAGSRRKIYLGKRNGWPW
jgi:hypothetical protein